MKDGGTETAARPVPAREALHAQIRALLSEPAVAERVAAGLMRDRAESCPPATVPKWLSDFIRSETGAIARVLPRLPVPAGLARHLPWRH